MKFVAEVRGQPKKIEPPYWIGEKFGDGKRPGLPDAPQVGPWRRRFFVLGCPLVDVGQFGGGKRRMFGGFAVFEEPNYDPCHAENASTKKSIMPTVVNHYPGYDSWGQDGAHVGAGVE